MKTKNFLSLVAIFAIASIFLACSSDSPSGGGEPSSNSSGGSEMVYCKLSSGTCSQMSRSACMEWVNANEATIVSNCNAEPPPSSSSMPSSSSPSANPKCGGNEYNPSTYFCSGNTIIAKCGGSEYDPSTQFCSGSTIYAKCGGNEYNPSTHFCSSNTPVVRCGGNEYNTTTQECTNNVIISFFTDTRNNKKYKTVDIGSQTWMAENLTYSPPNNPPTSYNDDDGCPNKNDNNCATYGRLYSWVTAMQLSTAFKNTILGRETKTQGVCPTGWHIPSDVEWQTLATSVGTNPGTKLKATSGWPSGANGTDNFGFTALPSGYIDVTSTPDKAYGFQTSGRWWTATDYDATNAINWAMADTSSNVLHYYQTKRDMLSVRCVKD